MDIDTGDSPPVSSRPYTLPLKHYEWVQREIESLERAGVITKSMSKWASLIVIVPKFQKSQRITTGGHYCRKDQGPDFHPSTPENQ